MFSIGVPHFKPFPSEVSAINLDTHAPFVSLFRLPRSRRTEQISKNDPTLQTSMDKYMFKILVFEAVYKSLVFFPCKDAVNCIGVYCIIYFFQPSPLQSMQSVFSYLKVGTAA